MNSNAVTLLSCGGRAVYTDEDEILVDALRDAAVLSSALEDGAVVHSTDAAADPLGLQLSAAFTIHNHGTNLLHVKGDMQRFFTKFMKSSFELLTAI